MPDTHEVIRNTMHYFRAFFKAVRLTLTGEGVPSPVQRYPNLHHWLETARDHLQALYQHAEQTGMNAERRQQVVLQLDGRAWSMELILSSVKFHLDTEYPSLLNSVVDHNLTTLYALHFDDKYRVQQLLNVPDIPVDLRPALQAFSEHFSNIPPSTDP
ncbi:MAG: hypothetical protein ACFE0Q_13000 [Anaerolineae bacterium]